MQLPGFAHYYSSSADIRQAAKDYADYQASGSTAGWDGSEQEAMDLEPTDDEIRNGGYMVMSEDDIAEWVAKWDETEDDTSWKNADCFISALAHA